MVQRQTFDDQAAKPWRRFNEPAPRYIWQWNDSVFFCCPEEDQQSVGRSIAFEPKVEHLGDIDLSGAASELHHLQRRLASAVGLRQLPINLRCVGAVRVLFQTVCHLGR